MKRKINKLIGFGIISCLFLAFVFVGCKDPLDDFKKDKVTAAEWEEAIDAIYTSFDRMIGGNFKIEISTEKEVTGKTFVEYSACELIAISCGEIEYLKEKKVERLTLNGVVESESETASERYLERTQGGLAFEYVYVNGEWIKKKSDAVHDSIVFDRVSSYNEEYREFFTRSLPRYNREEKGYYSDRLYKIKDKKVASISLNKSETSSHEYRNEENVLFLYDYGKQEITLPK